MTPTTARKLQTMPECWACSVRAAKPSYIRSLGWAVRTTIIDGVVERETYCPACFAQWGWPMPMERREKV